MILLSAKNLSKTYMERRVLDDVSFFLNEGDKVGIIGVNGTGKSTLLRILAGAEEADSGEVIRTSGVRISYLPQIPEFEAHGSVLEQVMLHLPEDLKEAKVFEAKSILGKLGISDVTREIGTLSGGERRLAGIAAALIQPSDILLLDEPTNHLDICHQLFVMDYLKQSQKDTLVVIHDLRLAAHYCDYLYMICDGEVYAQGTPQQVLSRENVSHVFGVNGYASASDCGGDFVLFSGGTNA